MSRWNFHGVYSDGPMVERIREVEEALPSEDFYLGRMVPDAPNKGLVSGKSS